MKEEFNGYFDEEEEKADKPSSKKVLEEKYEELKVCTYFDLTLSAIHSSLLLS